MIQDARRVSGSDPGSGADSEDWHFPQARDLARDGEKAGLPETPDPAALHRDAVELEPHGQRGSMRRSESRKRFIAPVWNPTANRLR
jgi:hypothetical protein